MMQKLSTLKDKKPQDAEDLLELKNLKILKK